MFHIDLADAFGDALCSVNRADLVPRARELSGWFVRTGRQMPWLDFVPTACGGGLDYPRPAYRVVRENLEQLRAFIKECQDATAAEEAAKAKPRKARETASPPAAA